MRVFDFTREFLRDADRLRRAAEIVGAAREAGGLVVVVPPYRDADLLLLGAAERAAAGDDGYLDAVEELRKRHIEAVRDLFPPVAQARVIAPLQIELNDLEDVLRGVRLVRECSVRTRDLVAGFGGRMAATLGAHYLEWRGEEAAAADAAALLCVAEGAGGRRIDLEESFRRVRERLGGAGRVWVVPAGIASAGPGVAASLEWEESTAAVLGAALGAEVVEVWTERDGVWSADPAWVPDARVLPVLTYFEAVELSYFGTRVLHPQAMLPAMEQGVPLRVRNGLRPELPGTRITGHALPADGPIRGVASADGIALVNVEGGGMVGIPGIAARIFATLAAAEVNVMMISQASSEHSICLVFREEEAERALGALRLDLADALAERRVQDFDLRRGLAVVAVVGENMRGTPGVAARLFGALGEEGINVLAIAQGSSERNISVVIAARERGRALGAVHRAFLGPRAPVGS